MPVLTFYMRFEIDDDACLLTDIDRGSAIPGIENMEKKSKAQRGHRQSKPLTVETLTPSTKRPDVARKPTSSSAAVHGAAEAVPFFSGNPFVEKTQGILHLYKRNDSLDASSSSAPLAGPSKTLCMIAVSAKFTCHDLLQFLAPYESVISKIRIIRDSSPNQYMVLVEFRDQPSADDCYNSCNGKPFNGIEKDICHLIYVSRVEIMKESEGAGLPVENHTELPTCPVCLERMDETVDGVLTVLCNHSFHGSCLSQWGDASCPVCRYSQTPELTPDQACLICGKQEDLWICLICGHTGCGRYTNAHAQLHYQQTQHTFSLEVGGQRVWDYAGDNYVHRLILSKSDGKVVEFESPADRASVQADEKVDAVTLEYTYLLTNQLESQRLYFEEKMTAIEKLMQSQLETVEKDNSRVIQECENLRRELKHMQDEKRQLEKKLSQANTKAAKAAGELKTELDTNAILRDDQQKWTAALRGLEQKLKETTEGKDKLEAVPVSAICIELVPAHQSTVTQGISWLLQMHCDFLYRDLPQYPQTSKVSFQPKEIADLQEQIRDLMFHFDAERQLESFSSDQKEDLTDARVSVAAAPPPKHTRRKHK